MTERFGIIGSSSMIATQAIEQFRQEPNLTLVLADIKSDNPINITDRESVDNFFKKNGKNLEWIILFAAMTDVNGAENQRNQKENSAWQVNVEGTRNIALACKKFTKKLVFFSTDFVFDGTNGPYAEDDPIGGNMGKISWYGITKIEAEKVIESTLSKNDYLILRISYPFSGVDTGKDDLALRTIHYFDKNREMYPMYDDQIITPTYIGDIAPAISTLIKKGARGTYHLASPKTTTQYEFAEVLLRHYNGHPIKLEKGKLADALRQEGKQKPTPRPIKGGLKVAKIQKMGINPTTWEEGISKIVKKNLKITKVS